MDPRVESIISKLAGQVGTARSPRPTAACVPSGIPELDKLLAGGWPRGACSLLAGASPALGVLPSILTVAQCSRSAQVAWVLPQGLHLNSWLLASLGADLNRLLVFSPAQGFLSWVLPQVLSCSHFQLVVVQADDPLTGRCLLRRGDAARLRQALQHCRAAVLLLRGPAQPASSQALPTALTLGLQVSGQGLLQLSLQRAAGRAPGGSILLDPGPLMRPPWAPDLDLAS
jgi:hypothetical protein